MARNRAFHRIALRGVSRINLSRRLMCWMDGIRIPRTALRIPRYVCCARLYQHAKCGSVCLVLCVGGVCTQWRKAPEKGGFNGSENLGGKKPEI